MTKNQLFREFYCRLSLEKTAELCFKSVTTVKRWDSGKRIPRECKRLMRMYSYRSLSFDSDWNCFYLEQGRLVLPSGQRLTPAQILLGSALIEISTDQDMRVSSKLIRVARALAKLNTSHKHKSG